jgi:hypothetical protein
LYLQQASALQVDAFIHKREAAHTLQKIWIYQYVPTVQICFAKPYY